MFRRLLAVHLRKAVRLRTGVGTAAGAVVGRDTENDGLSDEARAALDALVADLDRIESKTGG